MGELAGIHGTTGAACVPSRIRENQDASRADSVSGVLLCATSYVRGSPLEPPEGRMLAVCITCLRWLSIHMQCYARWGMFPPFVDGDGVRDHAVAWQLVSAARVGGVPAKWLRPVQSLADT